MSDEIDVLIKANKKLKRQVQNKHDQLKEIIEKWSKDVTYWKGEHGKLLDVNGELEVEASRLRDVLKMCRNQMKGCNVDGWSLADKALSGARTAAPEQEEVTT